MLISVNVSFGELVDKITILELKSKMIQDADKLININNELKYLTATYEKSVNKSAELTKLKDELYSINEKLWQIEDDIRNKERKKQYEEAFIELARSVYYTNDIRSELKRKINLLLGSELVEEKSYEEY